MYELEILNIVENNYINSFNSNGLHVIRQYLLNGQFIKYHDYLVFNRMRIKGLTTIQHLGIKLPINDDFEVLAYFTSHPQTYFFNNFIINNHKLSEGLKYINHPILVSRSNFADYISIVDNYENIPKNLKDSKKDKAEDLLRIHELCFDSFKKIANYYSISGADTLHETVIDYRNNLETDSKGFKKIEKNNIKIALNYSDIYSYQNQIIDSNDIFKFIKNLKTNKNIRNETLSPKNFIL